MSTMNLLPDYYARRRFQHRVDLICVVLFAVVMASLIGANAFSRERIESTYVVQSGVDARFSEAAKFVNEFFGLQQKRGKLLQDAKIASSMESTVPPSYLLALAANCRGEKVCLSSIEMKTRTPAAQPVNNDKAKEAAILKMQEASAAQTPPAEVPAPEPEPTVTLELVGAAESDQEVAQYLAGLKACPLLKQVVLRYTEEVKVRGVAGRGFQIGLEVKRGADVLDVIAPKTSGDGAKAQTLHAGEQSK